METIIANPLLVVILALAAAIVEVDKKQLEHVIPRVIIAAIYILIMAIPELLPEIIRQFLVRWGIVLMFSVEVISHTLRKYIHARFNLK